MVKTLIPSVLHGSVSANPSKSAMQRAVAAALLSKGRSVIRNPGWSQDCLASLRVAADLGAVVEKRTNEVVITGQGVHPITHQINCGESGLGIRMFTPIAAISSLPLSITGEGSLTARPMDFFERVLPQLGVRCKTNQGKLPLEIQGPLEPRDIEVDGSLSSQFLTGLLMAYGATADRVEIQVRGLNSKPYIALTLGLMTRFGVLVEEQEDFGRFLFGRRQSYHPADYTVEGDWSGAAFLLVAGALSGQVLVRQLDGDSAQADKAVLTALEDAGAEIRKESRGFNVSATQLKAFRFNATDCPDLVPPLVALASGCSGTSRISGAGRLAYKESDRAKVLQEEFAKLGIPVHLEADDLVVTGGKAVGATISSHGDHRIAMAGAIAGLVADGPVIIREAEAVDKSYPEFWDHLAQLGARID